jgi:hypothetical protein
MSRMGVADGPRTAAGRYLWSMLTDDQWTAERVREGEAPELITSSSVMLGVLRRLLTRRFPAGGDDLGEISRYVVQARERNVFGPSPDEPRIAEAMIRWFFGDAWIVAGISDEEAGLVMGGVLGDLVADLDLTEDEVVTMIVAAEEDPVPGLTPGPPP